MFIRICISLSAPAAGNDIWPRPCPTRPHANARSVRLTRKYGYTLFNVDSTSAVSSRAPPDAACVRVPSPRLCVTATPASNGPVS